MSKTIHVTSTKKGVTCDDQMIPMEKLVMNTKEKQKNVTLDGKGITLDEHLRLGRFLARLTEEKDVQEEKEDDDDDDDDFFQQQRIQKQQQQAPLNNLLQQEIIFQDASAKCAKCGQFTVRYRNLQKRSADEGETTLFKCTAPECNYKRVNW